MKTWHLLVLALTGAGTLFWSLIQSPKGPSAPVASLAGTQTDGALGPGFVLDGALKDRFDYWLSTLGELGLAALPERLAQSLREAGWSEADIGQALAAFARYQQYLKAMASLAMPNRASAGELQAAWAERDALRGQFFSAEEIETLWGADKGLEELTLRRLEIQALDLDPQARQDWLDDELAKAPPEVQRALGPSQRLNRLGTMEGASRDQLAAEFGDQVADRLEQVKAARQDWQQRVAAYRAEAERLQGLPQAERQAALAHYGDQHFTQAEQRRLDVWLRHQLQ